MCQYRITPVVNVLVILMICLLSITWYLFGVVYVASIYVGNWGFYKSANVSHLSVAELYNGFMPILLKDLI